MKSSLFDVELSEGDTTAVVWGFSHALKHEMPSVPLCESNVAYMTVEIVFPLFIFYLQNGTCFRNRLPDSAVYVFMHSPPPACFFGRKHENCPGTSEAGRFPSTKMTTKTTSTTSTDCRHCQEKCSSFCCPFPSIMSYHTRTRHIDLLYHTFCSGKTRLNCYNKCAVYFLSAVAIELMFFTHILRNASLGNIETLLLPFILVCFTSKLKPTLEKI